LRRRLQYQIECKEKKACTVPLSKNLKGEGKKEGEKEGEKDITRDIFSTRDPTWTTSFKNE